MRHVLAHYRQPALVERYIEGREIYVSMLGPPDGRPADASRSSRSTSPRCRPIARASSRSRASGWRTRTSTAARSRCAATGLTPELSARIADAALAAFEALELRDYARVDIRLAADGTPYVIDVNPNCDLSDVAGGFSKAAKAAGLGYDEVILRIVELALARKPNADTIPLSARSRTARRSHRPGRAVAAGGAVERGARSRARSG